MDVCGSLRGKSKFCFEQDPKSLVAPDSRSDALEGLPVWTDVLIVCSKYGQCPQWMFRGAKSTGALSESAFTEEQAWKSSEPLETLLGCRKFLAGLGKQHFLAGLLAYRIS